MYFKMLNGCVLVFLVSYFNVVLLQGIGSGTDGNLRLCIVEGRGTYKRGSRYCPVLDEEKSGVECVLGTDRLDCLRRISKGTVDFGAFSPEDLVAAQWAKVDVLVTNELRLRDRPFARSIVAVVNRRILPEGTSTLAAVLRNRTLCYPVVDADDIRPLSDTLARYLESLVTARSCDPSLSLAENRIKETAEFFGRACKAGPWVLDKTRDAELKRRYPSLCAACASQRCTTSDLYWGDSGALTCMAEDVGDVTWAELGDVIKYFRNEEAATSGRFAYLCRDGSSQAILNNSEPCVWLQKPWPVIVAKTKAAAAVSDLTSSLTNSSVTVDGHWHGALAALLEAHQELPEPLRPPQAPMDYLAKAQGFREAYSQHGCDPPRHITLCTTSLLESNKCEWLSEAAAVYGVLPPLQCARRAGSREALAAVQAGECDVALADSDWLVQAMRNYSLITLLHEATPIIEKTNTVVAYVRKDSKISNMADLRGKRASFPRFDGVAFHSVLRYLTKKNQASCKSIARDYFSEICAPGIENYGVTEEIVQGFTKNCYKDGDRVLEGEMQALRSLVEGKSDVAFISMNTFKMYTAKQIEESWATTSVELVPVCPDENQQFCFVAWSNIGHVFASANLTSMRRQEIVNVFTQLDQLFGKKHFNSLMFSMYGPYNHKLDVLFHNSTRTLATNDMYKVRPYSSIPLSFERVLNETDSCQFSDFTRGFGARLKPAVVSVLCLFISLLIFS